MSKADLASKLKDYDNHMWKGRLKAPLPKAGIKPQKQHAEAALKAGVNGLK